MKLIIDIDKDTHKNIIENGFISDEDNGIISYAIQLGKPIPDNATNKEKKVNDK